MKKLLRTIFGYESWQDQSDSKGSIFPDRTPAEHIDSFNFNKYNRKRRRGGAFCLVNERTGAFLKQKRVGEEFQYTECELDEATIWKSLKTVKLAGDYAWAYRPNMELTYMLVILDQEGKRQAI